MELDITKESDKCLRFLLRRYIAGNVCLERARGVSRKKLALTYCHGLNVDLDAYLLKSQIETFDIYRCNLSGKEKITLLDLSKSNKALTSENKRGGYIRNAQSWIGTSYELAEYITPPPEKLNAHLKDLLHYINDPSIPIAEKAINSYATLLRIHPFIDGNGRTSRLIYDVLAFRSDIDFLANVHFSTFRLGGEQNSYKEFLSSCDIGSYKYHCHHYWLEAMSWQRDFYLEFNDLKDEFKAAIESKFNFACGFSESELYVLNKIICKPVFSQGCVDSDSKLNLDVMFNLSSLGVFSVQKYLNRESILFVCDETFYFWQKVEELILKNKRV
ncbi:Fic family protein [Aestuariibacter sp. AA17]|uniref:Fic family protein n=1 Tax=Fluctibacter corallii TaxID=2984329 RepID=A0ABT3A7E8_9ALTE|nr:Fic family protein [Aestuariibacter sp. AA17]MCV2884499.1 Fic family protein [Aestuariibacter sp. AA17]